MQFSCFVLGGVSVSPVSVTASVGGVLTLCSSSAVFPLVLMSCHLFLSFYSQLLRFVVIGGESCSLIIPVGVPLLSW